MKQDIGLEHAGHDVMLPSDKVPYDALKLGLVNKMRH
jgi:hypothetical protein